mgnify:CR=1 FL=1|jgi:hypothetical protein
MKEVLFITSFRNLSATINVNEELINQLSKNFKNIYFINAGNLAFTKDNKIDENIKSIKKLPNMHFINPKNFQEFDIFLKNKDVFVISNFGRYLYAAKINFFLKKKKLKIFQVSNLGFFNVAVKYDFTLKIYPIIKHFFAVKFFKVLSVIFSNLGIFPKIEVRFISNKNIIDNVNKHPIKRILYKKKLFFTKELKLVNSKSYDLYKKNILNINEDYIVHLDKEFDWPELVAFRGKYDEQKLKKHYFFLNQFLSKLSKDYNKEVKVCIHPGYEYKKFRNYFPNFEVIQFKTREYIYKSFMVTMIDSSAVVDAILLKKKILGLTSDYMGLNEKNYSINNIERYGIKHFNIEKDITKNKKFILEEVTKKINNYDKYISQYLCFNENISGYEMIIKTIKEKTL